MKPATLIVILPNIDVTNEVLPCVRKHLIESIGTLNIIENGVLITAIVYNGILPKNHKQILTDIAESYQSTKLLFVEFDNSAEYESNTLTYI